MENLFYGRKMAQVGQKAQTELVQYSSRVSIRQTLLKSNTLVMVGGLSSPRRCLTWKVPSETVTWRQTWWRKAARWSCWMRIYWSWSTTIRSTFAPTASPSCVPPYTATPTSCPATSSLTTPCWWGGTMPPTSWWLGSSVRFNPWEFETLPLRLSLWMWADVVSCLQIIFGRLPGTRN